MPMRRHKKRYVVVASLSPGGRPPRDGRALVVAVYDDYDAAQAEAGRQQREQGEWRSVWGEFAPGLVWDLVGEGVGG